MFLYSAGIQYLHLILLTLKARFSWSIFNKSYKTEAEQAADLLKLIENMSNQNPAIIQMLTQALSQQQFTSSTAASSSADSAERTINQSGLNVKR